MTAQEAVDAMNGVFLAAWVAAGYSAANVRWSDVPGDIPSGSVVWARVSVKHFSGAQTSLAGDDSTHTNEGIFAVQCFAPVGDGDTAAYTAAQSVVTAIRKSKNIDVWFRNARLKEVGISGAFQQINVLADFTYDN